MSLFLVHSYSSGAIILDPKPKQVGYQVLNHGGPWTLTFAPTLQSTKAQLSLSVTSSRLANVSREKLAPSARLASLGFQPPSELGLSNSLLLCSIFGAFKNIYIYIP